MPFSPGIFPRFIWYRELQAGQDEFIRDMSRQAIREILALTRTILADLANEDLESRIIQAFLDHLQRLDKAGRNEIADLARGSSQGIVISPSFEIPQKEGQRMSQLIKDFIPDTSPLHFQLEPDLICGLELRANGRKIGWSIKEYLRDLEKQIGDALRKSGQEEAGAR